MGSSNGKPVLREEDISSLSRTSGMAEAEIRTRFESFVSEHPNGRMTKTGFRSMITQALPKQDADKMEKHVFRIYDTNNDGYIDFVEFMVVFHILSEGSPEEVLKKLFRVFDVNSDGTISKREMKRLVKDLYGLLKVSNPEECTKEVIASSAFAEMDKDEDGQITIQEFCGAVMAQEQFSKILAMKLIHIFIDDDQQLA